MVCLISRSHKKEDGFPVVGIHPHHPYPTSLSSPALVAERWISSARRCLTVHSPHLLHPYPNLQTPRHSSLSSPLSKLQTRPSFAMLTGRAPHVPPLFWAPPVWRIRCKTSPFIGDCERRKFPFKDLTHTALVLYPATVALQSPTNITKPLFRTLSTSHPFASTST